MPSILNMSELKTSCGKTILSPDKRGLKKREALHTKSCKMCQNAVKSDMIIHVNAQRKDLASTLRKEETKLFKIA